MKAKLEATKDQARTAAALVVSELQASNEMTRIKGSSYDEGVLDFLYTVVTKRLDWDLSFLGAEMSALVAEWRAPVPSSDEPSVTLPPLEYRFEQVIEAYLVINLEKGDDLDDDLEWIDDPRGVLDHQDN